MPSVAVRVPTVKGLIPTVDRKKIGDPHIVAGKNFYVDADGPVSGFGHSLLARRAINEPGLVQEFRVQNDLETFIFHADGIYTIAPTARRLVPVYVFDTPNTVEFPWSHALVGGVHYFARKGSPLLQYDVITNKWAELSGGSIPENVYAVCESEGRLIALTDVWVAWSAIDDGTDFLASTDTGAGAQSLSKLGITTANHSLAVLPTFDGFIVYTTKGMMKGTAVNLPVSFRHDVLSRRHIPINPFCIVEYRERQHVFLTVAGFFATSGAVPELWEPLMSEYFHRTLIPKFDIRTNKTSFRMYSNFDRGWVLISIASTESSYVYTSAYIHYTPTQQWGAFNLPHRALGDYNISSGAFAGFNFGFVDLNGSIYRFDDGSGNEGEPEFDIWNYFYRPPVEYPGRYEDGVYRFPTRLHMHTQDESAMLTVGWYNTHAVTVSAASPELTSLPEVIADPESETIYIWPEGDDVVWPEGDDVSAGLANYRFGARGRMRASASITGVLQIATPYESLDAYIEIGLFRLGDEENVERFSFITDVSISMLEAPETGGTRDDWNDLAVYPEDVVVDWELLDGTEDWGGAAVATSDYDFDLISSFDGYNEIEDSGAIPELIEQDGKTKNYSCHNNGLYHIIRISAEEVGQNFHLKLLEFDLHEGGRIY